MEEALRPHTVHDARFPPRVSILVLMEEALRPYVLEFTDSSQMGFNPCFNGRGVKTLAQVCSSFL